MISLPAYLFRGILPSAQSPRDPREVAEPIIHAALEEQQTSATIKAE
jgi:hypothetical protein